MAYITLQTLRTIIFNIKDTPWMLFLSWSEAAHVFNSLDTSGFHVAFLTHWHVWSWSDLPHFGVSLKNNDRSRKLEWCANSIDTFPCTALLSPLAPHLLVFPFQQLSAVCHQHIVRQHLLNHLDKNRVSSPSWKHNFFIFESEIY